MKKLISLVTVVAIVAASSLCAFASTDITSLVADAQPIAANETTGLYDVVAPSTGDYSTILAVKGKTIQVGAIQYINQAAAENGSATFNFALNDDLLTNETSAPITDDVYVLTGGDGEVNVAGYIDVTPEEQTAFTVSGTVIDPSEAVATIEMLKDPEFGLDDETIEYFEEGWGIKVHLLPYDETCENLLNYLFVYIGDDSVEAPTPIATADVDLANGSYSFADVENGSYTMIIGRAGMLPLFTYVTVNGANVNVPTKTLINGNVAADMSVDGYDTEAFFSVFGKEFWNGDAEYTPAFDVVPDGAFDGYDTEGIFAAFGSDMLSYNEQAIEDVYSALE